MLVKAVINASPLIFLSKLERLCLLNELFETIYIPDAVLDEINAETNAETNAIKQPGINNLDFKQLTVTNRTAVTGLLGRLHIGEVETIIGAIEHGFTTVILDDNAARNKAKQFGLSVTGTLGVLLKASKRGLVSNLDQDISKLIKAGLYVSDEIIKRILNKDINPL